MSEKNNQDIVVKAAEFEKPSSQSEARDQATNQQAKSPNKHATPWWHSQFNMMLCIFAVLSVLAILMIVLIPQPAKNSVNTVLNSAGEASVENELVGFESEAPWDENRRQQARSDAQEILAQLLSVKKTLESKGVKNWASEAYFAALQQAELGDESYKSTDFKTALERYGQALNSMQALNGRIPKVLKDAVQNGNQALAEGKSELAKTYFQAALKVDYNHIPALSGLDRASKLDQVLALVESAKEDEQAFASSDDISIAMSAEQKYQKALNIDARYVAAKTGQERINNLLVDKRYRDAMTQGFAALFTYKYSQAQQAFSQALKLKPNDSIARSAYRQSLASDKRSSLKSLLANAKALEQSEDWSQAMSTYQSVLQRDPNQVSAKLGVIRTRARSELDERLRQVKSDPLSLSVTSKRQVAQQVLSDAQAIKQKGVVLEKQIASLKATLDGLDNEVRVEFRSDGATDVSLIKEGARRIKLGTFAQKKMALKPGRYVLTGSRLGYNDVRKEIQILAGDAQTILNYSVVCDRPIGADTRLEQG